MNEFILLHGHTVLVSLRLQPASPNISCYFLTLVCIKDSDGQIPSCCSRSILNWNLMSNNFFYTWNLTSIILQAGDIESNPGPRPIDPNPIFCIVCHKKINRGPQLEVVPTCLVEGCIIQCHQSCNGLTAGQTRNARNTGKIIQWKCPIHGDGKAVITKPTQTDTAPVLPAVNFQPPTGRMTCSVCNKTIQARYAASAYHCSFPTCPRVRHLTRTCSGFIEPRKEV